MRIKNILNCLLIAVVVSGCVTKVINSDGTVQNVTVDKNKLSDTYVSLAVEYQKHGAPQVALDRVNLAIETNSSNARAYMVRGMIYDQLNKPDLAEDDFKKSISINPNLSDAYVSYAGFLCDKQRYDEAMKNFATALNNPLYFTPEVGYLNKAKCEYKMNDFEAANSDLMRSLSFKNVLQDSYILLAQIQYQQNNFVVAKYYIDKYSGTQTPTSLWLHIQILQALIDSGVDGNRLREYTSYRNTLARVLTDDYSNSQEAQYCLIKYGQPSSMSSLPLRNSSVQPPKAPTNVAQNVKTITPLPYQPVSTTVNPVPNASGVDRNDAVIVDNSTNSGVSSSISNKSNIVQTGSDGRRYIIMPNNVKIYSIAKQYGLTSKEIEKYNNLKSANVKPGTKIFLDPVTTKVDSNSGGSNSAQSTSSTSQTTTTTMSSVSDAAVLAAINGVDSSSTAVSTNQSSSAMVGQNVARSDVSSQQVSNNPSSISASAIDSVNVSTDASGRRYIIVPPKSTAFSISKRFNISVKQLEQYNRMKSAQVVSGMKLYVDPVK